MNTNFFFSSKMSEDMRQWMLLACYCESVLFSSCIINKDRPGGQKKVHAAACFGILTPAKTMSSRDPGKEADDLRAESCFSFKT